MSLVEVRLLKLRNNNVTIAYIMVSLKMACLLSDGSLQGWSCRANKSVAIDMIMRTETESRGASTNAAMATKMIRLAKNASG